MSDLGIVLSTRATAAQRTRSRIVGRSIAAGIWLVVVGNAAVIVWHWLRAHGIDGVHNAGGLWTSLGRITGLLSAYLALLQVLLLARLPGIEQLAGFDRLTVWISGTAARASSWCSRASP